MRMIFRGLRCPWIRARIPICQVVQPVALGLFWAGNDGARREIARRRVSPLGVGMTVNKRGLIPFPLEEGR
jgi:hypothetical protein